KRAEAITSVAIRHRRGHDRSITIEQLNGDAGDAQFKLVQAAVPIAIRKRQPIDFSLHEEHIPLQVIDRGIAPNHACQGGLLQIIELLSGENALIPEAVTVAEPLELIRNN